MLIVENLYAGYGKVQVLHGLSMQVPDGKLVTLIGSNGAGKTTTLRALSGMIQPTGGRISLGGADITGLAGGDLTLTNRGSGAFRAAPGRVDRVTLNLSGSGDLDLARLQARDVAISLLGSGTARIRASDTITGRVSGSGALFYGGSAPTLEEAERLDAEEKRERAARRAAKRAARA